jgi:WD40 repeat protein
VPRRFCLACRRKIESAAARIARCYNSSEPEPREGRGIYIIDADGSDHTLLADEHIAGPCDWSPDGTKIAFSSQVGGTGEIYVMNADGSGKTNLTRTSTNWESDPDWSPDGTRIAFESGWDEDIDIYTMNPDGSEVAQVTHSRAMDMDPDWEPVPGPTPPKRRSEPVHPPDTGGPSLLLVASALLCFSGVLLYAVVKRRM